MPSSEGGAGRESVGVEDGPLLPRRPLQAPGGRERERERVRVSLIVAEFGTLITHAFGRSILHQAAAREEGLEEGRYGLPDANRAGFPVGNRRGGARVEDMESYK